jgi:RimJ/RimL family protein N-acetyltransferase
MLHEFEAGDRFMKMAWKGRESGPAFQTERLNVSEWHDASRSIGVLLPEVVRSFLTPRVTSQLPPDWRGGFSSRRAIEWVADRDAEGVALLASSRETGEPVGLVLLHAPPPSAGRAELRLGYLIEEAQWGRGFASELVLGVVTWARSAGYDSIVAGVSSDNVPSRRVLEKADFVRLSDVSCGPGEAFFGIDL